MQAKELIQHIKIQPTCKRKKEITHLSDRRKILWLHRRQTTSLIKD